jgi:hypothetical protein
MMGVAVPGWLANHDGSVVRDVDSRKWLVLFRNEPQYHIDVHPAGGEFAADIVQSNNGRHVGSTKNCPSERDALAAGLEELRKLLGW